MTHDPNRPTHEQSLRATITRLESDKAELLAACKRIVSGAVECEMHDSPSQVDGIEWDDVLAVRAAIAKAEAPTNGGAA